MLPTSEYGFTNLPDCQVGVRYSYCPPDTDCGPNCRGPCANGDQECLFNDQTKQFECSTPPAQDKPFWKQAWFIVVVIIAAIFLAMIILFFIITLEKKEDI